ncbi:MAG: cation transporter [Christensenellales bacterium]
MTKVVRLENLGCANCAAKMEKKVAALEGVSACTVNFLSARMTIQGEEARMPLILSEAAAIVRRIEPQAVLRA